MEKRFDIEKRDFHCPNCGQKNPVKLEDEVSTWAGLLISIEKQTDDVFVVNIVDSVATIKTVAVTDQSLTDLTDNNVTKTQLLEFYFNFLLDGEPNTSILSSFDIKVISKYFSDYRDEVRRRCDAG